MINQKSTTSPFGSRTRTRLLLTIYLLEDSFPRELARILRTPLFGVQKALASLESDGLVAGRMVGRTRLYRLNPRYFAARQLRALIEALAQTDEDLQARVSAIRRRPRASGKTL